MAMTAATTRVMIVDDSAVIRGIVHRLVDAEADLSVVASVGDGRQALLAASRTHPDIVVLDIEMPVLDGLATLPQLLAIDPQMTIVMASTLTQRNAEITLRALSLGAADYVPKPDGSATQWTKADFARELTGKLRAYGARRQGSARPPIVETPKTAALQPGTRIVPARAIAIGSSTGGPQALTAVLSGLGPVDVPVFITQHMPPAFTKTLADHLSRHCNLDVREATDGEAVMPGVVYVAPGGRHMRVERGTSVRIVLTDDPPENFSRPAVDPMLRSLSAVFGDGLCIAILTGMGSDGLAGCQEAVRKGGRVVAQDEASSVVWGMPGAVARAGICASVLPVSKIAAWLRASLTGGASA